MRRTNLIPQTLLSAQSRLTFKTQGEYALFLILISIFSLFLVLEVFQVLGIGIFAYQIKMQNNKLTSLKKQLSENNKIREDFEKQIKGWRERTKETEAKIAFLESEVGQDVVWSGVLAKLNSFLPARLWLVNLYLSKDLITIKGNTYDNLLISTFISNLSSANLFSDINLGYVRKNRIKAGADSLSEREIIEFEITARLIGIEPKEALGGTSKEGREK